MKKRSFVMILAFAAAVLGLFFLAGCVNTDEPGPEPTRWQATVAPDGTTPAPRPTPSVIIPYADTYKGDTDVMNKKSLELYIGEKDSLSVKNITATLKWYTTDPGVAVVDETTGEITAVGCGDCVITAEGGGVKASSRVYVVEKEFSFDDNILISIFWPPTREYVNDEQYKLMKDAQIDWVLGAGDNLSDDEVQLKMAELCYKYGIHLCAAPPGTGSALQGSPERSIKALIESYRNIPAVNGYYILDEPFNPNVFIKAYTAMKEQDPSAYMHLNFLPYGSYGSTTVYMSQMNDWAKLCANTGHPIEYIMYDLYPFGLEAGSMNRTAFLINLDCARKVGLRNNVKTANYIQSVEQSVAFRSPNREETLYEINMSLAFGIKQISYFTWFTPHDRSEPFDKGIISSKGVPSDKYKDICELDDYVHKIGKTLIRCDALEVYQGRDTYNAIDLVPDDFFVTFKKKADFTLSYLRDKCDGRNYVMLVNNSFQKAKSCTLVFDSDISGDLSFVDGKDGSLKTLKRNGDGSLDLELEAGDAIIIAMPEGYDYSSKKTLTVKAGENLAKYAEISCSNSLGSGGWYMDNLNDGDRYGKIANGWQTEANTKKASLITITFKKEFSFNRIDVYPTGNLVTYGDSAPESYIVYVSDNGTDWRQLEATVSSCGGKDALKKITFERQTARYLRLECDSAKHKLKICEIEVYDDDGSVQEPSPTEIKTAEARGNKKVSYKKDSNIALKKDVTVSSYPAGADYKSWGWWPTFINDGNQQHSGWTSNVKANTVAASTEYVVIDLGDYFEIGEVRVYAAGCWPKDFQIRISNDMLSWTAIADEKNSKAPETYYSCSGEFKTGRYVMFVGTKLTNTAADGYMLQLGEIEVYGRPHVDYDEAKALADRYLALGGSSGDSSYKAVMAEINGDSGSGRAKGTLTQSGLDVLLKAMLAKVGTTIEKETNK